jgi:hypothetical protein
MKKSDIFADFFHICASNTAMYALPNCKVSLAKVYLWPKSTEGDASNLLLGTIWAIWAVWTVLAVLAVWAV